MNLVPKVLIVSLAVTIVSLLGVSGATKSSKKKEARVTQIIKDVSLLPTEAPPRPAVRDDLVSENTGVRTGDESRSELTFEDLTITRLGANTIFSFNKAGRVGDLGSGSVLLYVPKNSGGAEFRTKAVSVGITGTTIIFESTALGNSKLLVLEGEARLKLVKFPSEVVKVRGSQLLTVPAGAAKIPPPTTVDLGQVMQSHPLITGFSPLPSQDLIIAGIKNAPPVASGSGPGSPGPAGTPNPASGTGTGTPATGTGQGATPGTGKPPKGGTGTGTPTPPANATPKVTATPKPPPKPTPKPVSSPKPTSSPKGTPRNVASIPPQTGNVIGPPAGQSGQSGQGIIPKKKFPRRTPTPSPPKIN